MEIHDHTQPDLFDAAEEETEEEKQERERLERERERLRKKVATRQLDTDDAKIAYLLSQFPKTRNSDIALQIEYWKHFQNEKLAGDLVPLDALYDLKRLKSTSRSRRTVQNDYRLYLPTSEKVARKRKQLREEYEGKYKPVDLEIPSLSVYADESGKNQDYLVVGSVWVLIPSEEVRLLKSIDTWKEEVGFNQEIKFNKISKSNRDRYWEFIERFILEEGALGFKAIAMKSKGIADEQAAFADLFFFLLRRGIEHEDSTGRAPLPRQLTFIKDHEEEGYDERLLALVTNRLETAAEAVFDGSLHLEFIHTEQSKFSVGLQIADLFTGCVSRIINDPAPQRGWKDDFAERFLEKVGMQNGLDATETYKDRAVRLSLQSNTLKDPDEAHQEADSVAMPKK